MSILITGAAGFIGSQLAYRLWKNKEDVKKNWKIDRTFVPDIDEAERQTRIKGWKKAVKCAYGWAKEKV